MRILFILVIICALFSVLSSAIDVFAGGVIEHDYLLMKQEFNLDDGTRCVFVRFREAGGLSCEFN